MATSITSDVGALLTNEFARWRASGAVADELLECAVPYGPDLDTFVQLSCTHALFVAIIAFEQGQNADAARYYAQAFTDERTHDSDEYAFLDAAATACGGSLASVLGAADGAALTRIVAWEKERQRRVHKEYDKLVLELEQPRVASDITSLAYYAFKRVTQPEKPFGDAYLVHKALFWAHAAWAFMHQSPLSSATPLRYDNGPYYSDVKASINGWRDGRVPAPSAQVEDASIRAVLDAAVDHVKELGWAAACEETHHEPLWILTHKNAPMSSMLRVYACSDASGALKRIFGRILECCDTLGDASSSAPRYRGLLVSKAGVAAASSGESSSASLSSAGAAPTVVQPPPAAETTHSSSTEARELMDVDDSDDDASETEAAEGPRKRRREG